MNTTSLKYAPLPAYSLEQWQDAAATVAPLRDLYNSSDIDEQAASTISRLLINREAATQGWKADTKMGLLLTGESGSGKTTLLRRVMRRQHALAADPELPELMPMVSMKIEPPVTLKSLGQKTRHKLGYPVRRDYVKADTWADVTERLHALDVKLVWYDEFQDTFTMAPERASAEILSTMKSLINNDTHPVVLILSGTPDLLAYAQQDTHFLRRMYQLNIPSLSSSETTPDAGPVLAVADAYCQRHAMTCELSDNDARRIIHAAGEQQGRVFELLVDAILEAVLAGSRVLSAIHFAHAYQRQANCLPSNNIFFAQEEAWPLLRSLHSDQVAPLIVQKRRSRPREKGMY